MMAYNRVLCVYARFMTYDLGVFIGCVCSGTFECIYHSILFFFLSKIFF